MFDLTKQIILIVLQSILIIGVSPLIIGYIRKVKAKFQNRVGASVLQPYYELYKLIRKDSVVSKYTSFVFLAVPYILIAIMITLSLVIPAITIFSSNNSNLLSNGVLDIIGIIYLFAFYTFALTIAAFDPATSFGGLGATRDYMFAILCEPLIFVAFIIPVILSGSTQLSTMISINTSNVTFLHVFLMIIGLAGFFIALLAENTRFPFDNPATHLELTMVHEAMVLEYSGKQLALVEYAAWIRLVLFMTIASSIFIPWGINIGDLTFSNIFVGLVFWLLKLFCFATVIALIESTIAKLRIFKLPALIAVSFLIVLIGVIYLLVYGR